MRDPWVYKGEKNQGKYQEALAEEGILDVKKKKVTNNAHRNSFATELGICDL